MMLTRRQRESYRAWWTARRLSLGLRKVLQNCSYDIVVDDERDDLHPLTALRAHQRVHLHRRIMKSLADDQNAIHYLLKKALGNFLRF
jgi:hypothetical protein